MLLALGANTQAHTIRISAMGKTLNTCFFKEYPFLIFFIVSTARFATICIKDVHSIRFMRNQLQFITAANGTFFCFIIHIRLSISGYTERPILYLLELYLEFDPYLSMATKLQHIISSMLLYMLCIFRFRSYLHRIQLFA